MGIKNKFLISFAFLLVVCSLFIVPIMASNTERDFNVPIYIQTSAGIERANSKTIADILLNYNFDIKSMQEFVMDERCSLRSSPGKLYIDEMSLDVTHFSFNIPLKNDGPGVGSLLAQTNRDVFELKFEVKKILEINSEKLVFEASGEGALNQEKMDFDSIVVTYDKINNKVEINGNDFYSEKLDVDFVEFCSGHETDFYLIIKDGKLENPRTTEQIDELLEQHLELVDAYENLDEVSRTAMIPEFSTLIGILTLAGAVGIFFFVRKR